MSMYKGKVVHFLPSFQIGKMSKGFLVTFRDCGGLTLRDGFINSDDEIENFAEEAKRVLIQELRAARITINTELKQTGRE